MIRITLSILVIGLLLTPQNVWAGERGPGKYCGTVVFDRWGSCTLYSGVYVMYVAEAAKEKLRPNAGKSIQLDATKVDQPINPGDGLISEFRVIGEAPDKDEYYDVAKLALRTRLAFKAGEEPAFEISVRNTSQEDARVSASELAPTLLAQKVDKSLYPSDGPSFALLTRQSFWIGNDQARLSGSGFVTSNRQYAWKVDRAIERVTELTPGDELRVKITFDLPAGEYDFLAGYGGGVHGSKGLASNLIAFDVDDKGKGKPVTVAGRVAAHASTRAAEVTRNN